MMAFRAGWPPGSVMPPKTPSNTHRRPSCLDSVQKDGQERPGAKGLSLSQEQWGIFVAALPALQAAM